MTLSTFGKATLGFAFSGALLAGCSGGSQNGSPQMAPLAPFGVGKAAVATGGSMNTSVSASAPKAVPSNHLLDWLSPDAAGTKGTVFVSDSGQNTIEIYSYATGHHLGHIAANLAEPQGMCTQHDTVWVANTADLDLIHYGVSGNVLGTLKDPGQFPAGCAFYHGKLAVSNVVNTTGGQGSVTVFVGGKGAGKNYLVPGMARVYFIAYDSAGNLFVDGTSPTSGFAIAERPKGASAFVALALSGARINVPGGLQYASGALAIGDQSGPAGVSVIYQTSISGTTLTVTGTTKLSAAEDAVQTCITPYSSIIAPDAGTAGVEIYDYPAGGEPIRTITGGLVQPVGCAFLR